MPLGNKRERVRWVFRDRKPKERGHYSKKAAGVILSLISVVMVLLTVAGVIFVKWEFNESKTDILRTWTQENPILAAALLIAVCCAQVVVALVPGEMVEIASGYMFGAVWGTILCWFGILLGSVCAMLLARRFGRKLAESFYPKEKLESLPVLRDPSRRNALTALLFLIPGTPKDLITYILGLTDMSIPMYLLLTGFSRLPSILVSTVGGNALGENRWLHAVLFFALSAAVSLTGYLAYRTIRKKRTAVKTEKEQPPVTGKTDKPPH